MDDGIIFCEKLLAVSPNRDLQKCQKQEKKLLNNFTYQKMLENNQICWFKRMPILVDSGLKSIPFKNHAAMFSKQTNKQKEL